MSLNLPTLRGLPGVQVSELFGLCIVEDHELHKDIVA